MLPILFTGLLPANAELTQGPLIGHTTDSSVQIWARVAAEGEYTLRYAPVLTKETSLTVSLKATATAENDFCIVWKLAGLTPDMEYDYKILNAQGKVLTKRQRAFSTLEPITKQAQNTTLMFGSCANDRYMPKQAIWKNLADRSDIGALVLLGDTPYIDSTKLATQRKRYRAFFGSEYMQTCVRDLPIYATWDDHDFGKNDTDGNLKGKANSRQAFIEYHALPSYGDGKNGIYTSFRQGPIEVFLLDTRWFAGTEPSPADATKTTLLGKTQWEWLQTGLQASTADVKILASGMIWNGSVRPFKKDHWGNYAHERDALFKFIGEKKISGVTLIGGDIHRSRIVKHDTEKLAGYPIHEFISSPMATSPIKAANQPHPGLIMDLGEPEVILEMSVNLSKLTARFLGPENKVYYSIILDISKMKSLQ